MTELASYLVLVDLGEADGAGGRVLGVGGGCGETLPLGSLRVHQPVFRVARALALHQVLCAGSKIVVRSGRDTLGDALLLDRLTMCLRGDVVTTNTR